MHHHDALARLVELHASLMSLKHEKYKRYDGTAKFSSLLWVMKGTTHTANAEYRKFETLTQPHNMTPGKKGMIMYECQSHATAKHR